MPLVIAKYSKNLYSDALIADFTPKVQQIIADRLSCAEYQLKVKDVDIEFIPRPSTYTGDIDLVIYIIGSDFPDRMARCSEMMKQVAADLKPILPPGSRGCGGVFLPHSFGWYFEEGS